ncbi:DUF3540 domain-containing protein [Sorangium sp. So ce233]|uniref:DUF3540 domain-containing protein n=1 Tax=Sorangium sp. So ce233 TaxID=3133290 RepID=UPI003F610C01
MAPGQPRTDTALLHWQAGADRGGESRARGAGSRHAAHAAHQRVKRVWRFVEGVDETGAGTINLRAQSLIIIRGDDAIISACVLAKVHGHGSERDDSLWNLLSAC